MQRAFRKYHRVLSLIIAIPFFLTVITGMLATLLKEWPMPGQMAEQFLGLMVRLHTGEAFHLEKIYPLLTGLGMIGLLVTGISLLQSKRKSRKVMEDVKL